MKINTQLIKEERAKRVWTQQHLADVTDLSLRTIQRIESIGAGGAESVKAIAAGFGIEPDALLQNSTESEKESTFQWNKPFKFEPRLTAFIFSILFLIAIPAVFLRSNDAVGHAEIYRFEGGIRVNDSMPHNFGISLRSNQLFILDVDSEHKLIMEITGSDDESKQAKIQLLRSDGTNYNVLHSSIRPGPDNHLHTVSYRICGDKVVYYGPSIAQIPKCNESFANTVSN